MIMKEYRSSELITDPSGIHVFFSDRSRLEESHVHDFSEIVYVSSGSAIQSVNGAQYTVRRGDLIFINVGSVHSFSSPRGFSYYNVCFDPGLIPRRIITEENAFAVLQLSAFEELRRENDEEPVSFSGRDADRMEAMLSELLEEYGSEGSFRSTALESLMNLIFISILRRISSGQQQVSRDVFAWLSDYIRDNPGEVLTLEALAEKCFYNPSYFSRCFKEKFNVTLTQYVNATRVEHAKELLEAGVSVDEAAQSSGFGSRSAFYRVFAGLTGTTPGEWRKTGAKEKR